VINNPATVSESPSQARPALDSRLKRVAEVMDRERRHRVSLHHFARLEGTRGDLDFSPMQLKPNRSGSLEGASRTGRASSVVSWWCRPVTQAIGRLEGPEPWSSRHRRPPRLFFRAAASGAEFTYFGKAYFDDALRRPSPEAFEIARRVIAERERKGNLRSSDRGCSPEGISGPAGT